MKKTIFIMAIFMTTFFCLSVLANATRCVDPDGGKSYSVKSTTTFTTSTGVKTYEDSCSGKYLVEYFCTARDTVDRKRYTCNCVEGRCTDYQFPTKQVGNGVETKLFYKNTTFMTILRSNGAVILKPQPGEAIGSVLYLQPFFAGANLKNAKIKSFSANDNNVQVVFSGKVSKGASSTFGTWNSTLVFTYDKSAKKVVGTGKYYIRLADYNNMVNVDLNLLKVSSNFLKNVPLLSGGTGNAGNFEHVDYSGSILWNPLTSPFEGHFPMDMRNSLTFNVVGKYNNVNSRALGLRYVTPLYKPSLKVTLTSSNTIPMIFGAMYNPSLLRNPFKDNCGVTPVVLRSRAGYDPVKDLEFDLTIESEVLSAELNKLSLSKYKEDGDKEDSKKVVDDGFDSDEVVEEQI